MTLTKVIAGMADDSVFEANKNVIINGNFDIWQRGTSFTSAASGIYAADRWQWFHSGTGVVDILQSTSVPDNTSDFSFQIDITTADTSIAAGDFYVFVYKVEGYDSLRFAFGTSDAKQLTLSFWVKSSKTGIHCVTLRNDGLSRSYIVEYTVDIADTWEQKSITLTADTTGTWLTDNSVGISILWALAVGTTFHNTANTWNASNSASTSNQVNVLDSAANNFHIAQVQLEVGSVATAFERRSFVTEFAMAQRYYTKTFPPDVVPASAAGRDSTIGYRVDSSSSDGAMWSFPVTMRTVPTISLFNPINAGSNWHNANASANSGTSSAIRTGVDTTFLGNTQIGGDSVGNFVEINATADAEL